MGDLVVERDGVTHCPVCSSTAIVENIRPAEPVVDGELPWTRADEEQMSAIADYAEGTIRGDA